MAWTDQCKIEAVNQIDHKMASGMTKREALRSVSGESDIPPGTLTRWKYGKKSGFKNEPKKKPSQKTAWKNVERKLSSLAKYVQENCDVQAVISEDSFEKMISSVDKLQYFVDEAYLYLED